MSGPAHKETDADAPKVPPVVVKKYANRRLYNTESSSYITLDNLADMVRAGRDFVVYDAKTGDVIYRDERLGALGDYYASLTAAEGNVYAISQRGVVTVFSGSGALEVLAHNDLGETVMATPALVDGSLYVRTESKLFRFGVPAK